MSLRTQALVVERRGGNFRLMDVDLDDPRPDEVLVRIVACGLCHTDLAGRDGLLGLRFPMVLGHEGAGIVERVGNAVTRVGPGDPVLLSFASCGECTQCLRGHPARCVSMDDLNFGDGTRPDGSNTLWTPDGKPVGGSFFGQSSLARHALVRDRNVVPVAVPSENALAGLAPLGCGLQAGAGTVLNELQPRAGESLAVFGAGSVGFAALMAGRLAGASPVVAIDIVPARLELALELGATHVIDARSEDVAERLKAIAGAFDHSLETTGKSRLEDLAVACLGPRGKASLLAVSSDTADDERVVPRGAGPEQAVFYSVAGDSDPQVFIPFLIERHREGRFPFDRLSREYPAGEIDLAVEDSLAGITIKPVIRF